MPRKPKDSTRGAAYFTLHDPKRRARVDALIARLNTETRAQPVVLATWLRAAIDAALDTASRATDESLFDEELLALVDAHVVKLNAQSPDDPYDRRRFVRVAIGHAIRNDTGHAIGIGSKRARVG